MITETDEQEFELLADGYSQSDWEEYERRIKALDDETRDTWQPIIYGAMFKLPLKDFLAQIKFKTDDEVEMYDPACGDMPDEVKIICYHAKRLDPSIIASIAPKDVKKAFEQRKRELLYGTDLLSVFDMFESQL